MIVSIRFAVVALAAATWCSSAGAATSTVLEVRWAVTLPKADMGEPLTKQALDQWHSDQAIELSKWFNEKNDRRDNRGYFAFWIFNAPTNPALPTFRVTVEPRSYDEGRGMGYTIEVVNLAARPLEVLKGKLFAGAVYGEFVSLGGRGALARIVERMTDLLMDEKEKLRANMMARVWVADRLEILPDGQNGLLPHAFDERIRDYRRSVFSMQRKDNNGGDPIEFGARGVGGQGMPPRFKVKFDTTVNANDVLEGVKVKKIVSDSEDGLLDAVPSPGGR